MVKLNMLNKLTFLFVICCLSCSLSRELRAQTFGASVIVGLNAAQINGDDMFGYNKPGILVGLRSNFLLSEKLDMDIELLYSERGSQNSLFNSSSGARRRIALQYLSIPVLITYHDWLSADDAYYKMRFTGGFSLARLFNASFVDDILNDFQNYENRLNDIDISLVLGATYKWSEKFGVGLRYNQSLNLLYDVNSDPSINLNGLKGLFWSLRLEYNIL